MTDPTIPSLVDTDWLAARLDEPDLRVLDCTVYLHTDDEKGDIWAESGREDWAESHVPGSAFADLIDELSAADPDYWLQAPDADRFAAAMEDLGVGDDTRVVLYDATGTNMWAARLWWLLRAFGFDDAAILDGGWQAWSSEGRPTSSAPPEHEPATFTPDPRPELLAGKEDVQASIDDGATCLVNARRLEGFLGNTGARYGRAGRIPSSVHVPAAWEDGVVDPETGRFRSREELRQLFAEAGAADSDEVITYCGAAIAASSVAFALHLLGVENVAVYDGSLAEWGSDPSLPLTTG